MRNDLLLFTLDADGKIHPAPVGAGLTELRDRMDMLGVRRVGFDMVGDAMVSTVFTGIDLGYGRHYVPVLWETRVGGGRHDMSAWPTTSRASAEVMHGRVVAFLAAESN